jgi:hypothetical protein
MTTVLPFPFEADKTLIDGRFLIKGELGQGGMGRCYRVWQGSLERLCVLKMLAPKLHPRFVPEPDARLLLEHEAKTLGLLAQGNDSFVQVFDRGTLVIEAQHRGERLELDLPYYIMEFLHGFSLEVLVDLQQKLGEFLPWPIVLTLAAQMARALSVAHERGVIHRDLKPDNMFVHRRVDRLPVLKLIDFGVSRREGSESRYGTGTARYGTPEMLARTAQRESTQSDIYPLGLVMFEVTTNRGPFLGRSKDEFIYAHVQTEPPRLATLRPDAPPFFADLVDRALAKNPARRPTAQQIADAIENHLATMPGAREAGAAIERLLQTVNGRAVRDGVAQRALSVVRSGALALTVAVPSVVATEAPQSEIYLSRSDIPPAAPAMKAPAVVQTVLARTAPLKAPVPAPVIRDVLQKTLPLKPAAPYGLDGEGVIAAVAADSIDDVEEVAVFGSMAQVFAAASAETDFAPPLGVRAEAGVVLETSGGSRRSRPNSSLSGVTGTEWAAVPDSSRASSTRFRWKQAVFGALAVVIATAAWTIHLARKAADQGAVVAASSAPPSETLVVTSPPPVPTALTASAALPLAPIPVPSPPPMPPPAPLPVPVRIAGKPAARARPVIVPAASSKPAPSVASPTTYNQDVY